MRPFIPSLFVCFFAATLARAADAPGEQWTPLFNGKDLTGWVNVNCAPSTWSVRDGLIVSTGIPTGVLRTDRHYENFVLELEWKHLRANGNAGLFVWSDPIPVRGQPFTRAVEVQIIDAQHPKGLYTRHGDVFPIQGATFVPDRPHPEGWMRSLPSENRVKPLGEWNHYRVECRDGRISLAVNGKVVSGGSESNPRKGYIVLESEGSEAHFRNIRIRELPTTHTPPAMTAATDQGFVSLYTGTDLNGWKATPAHAEHWKAKDWILDYDGKGDGETRFLESAESYGDFDLILDWRQTGKDGPTQIPLRLGGQKLDARTDRKPGEWNRAEISVRNRTAKITLNGKPVETETKLGEVGPLQLGQETGAVQFANIYVKKPS